MNNQRIVLEQSYHDQRSDTNLQENSHSITNINDLEDISHNTNGSITNSQINFRLEQHSDRSLFSLTNLTTTCRIFGFALFTILSIMISVIIICFTTNKSSK